ncbi:hypothetical protein D9619_009665 [Psilocybe cf. subviscida]|uniref:BTB domain-containing protein n=1 Tax=Psilocybe cf. subviscida TaxID=2480587 RepID=A0A8H5F651_9AGAR|nr:hypothetical protein D9619_009665 [Psilocybe cf. subviscida]
MEQPSSTADVDIVSAPAPEPVIHNSVWNLETICFKVENQLFTVIKKDLLGPGSVFVDMFKVPSGPQPAEGKDADNPIDLHGIKASHFAAFLSVLYPWINGSIELRKQDEDSVFGVLHLANMWRFPKIRHEAVRISSENWIPSKSDAEKIRLGEEYQVQDWAFNGYTQIIRRKGFKFGDLENEPYNFDQTLVKKILYLQAESGCSRCGNSYSQRRENPMTRELLHDELARASDITDDYASLD